MVALPSHLCLFARHRLCLDTATEWEGQVSVRRRTDCAPPALNKSTPPHWWRPHGRSAAPRLSPPDHGPVGHHQRVDCSQAASEHKPEAKLAGLRAGLSHIAAEAGLTRQRKAVMLGTRMLWQLTCAMRDSCRLVRCVGESGCGVGDAALPVAQRARACMRVLCMPVRAGWAGQHAGRNGRAPPPIAHTAPRFAILVAGGGANAEAGAGQQCFLTRLAPRRTRAGATKREHERAAHGGAPHRDGNRGNQRLAQFAYQQLPKKRR